MADTILGIIDYYHKCDIGVELDVQYFIDRMMSFWEGGVGCLHSEKLLEMLSSSLASSAPGVINYCDFILACSLTDLLQCSGDVDEYRVFENCALSMAAFGLVSDECRNDTDSARRVLPFAKAISVAHLSIEKFGVNSEYWDRLMCYAYRSSVQ